MPAATQETKTNFSIEQPHLNPVTVARLEAGATVGIDLAGQPVLDTLQTVEKFGVTGQTVANLQIGDELLAIIDVRRPGEAQIDNGSQTDFIIMSHDRERHHAAGQKGYGYLKHGETLVLGREHEGDDFKFSTAVSREHAQISFDAEKGLIVENKNPRNRTVVTAPLRQVSREVAPMINANATQNVIGRLGVKAINLNMGEKEIISSETTSFNGAVCYGEGSREAILVDGESEKIQDFYQQITTTIKEALGKQQNISPEQVLKLLMHNVLLAMPYDERYSSEVARSVERDEIVPLSSYLDAAKGVCRHQNLLGAYMIEKLVEDGYLPQGEAHRERNKSVIGKHAWASYVVRGGQKIIFDATNKYVGPVQGGRWDYRLEE